MCDTKGCCSGGGCVGAMVIKILLVVGGLNWGLVGVGMLMGTDLNVVHMLLAFSPTVEAVVYVFVGLAAVGKLIGCKCSKCKGGSCSSCAPSGQSGMGSGMSHM